MRSWLYRLVALATCIAAPAVLAAERPFAAPEAVEQVPTAGAGSLVQVTLSLLLVLGVVFAAAWLMRRLRGVGRFGGGAIEILAEAPLGAKERAVLVQVGKQQLLIGVAPGQVTTLHVLQEPVTTTVNAGGNNEMTPSGGVDFKSVLKRSLGL